MKPKTDIKISVLRPRLRAAGLVLPLLAFIGITFIAPLGTMLIRSIYDPVVADALPETLDLLSQWDGTGTPDEAVYTALARELRKAYEERTLGRVAGARQPRACRASQCDDAQRAAVAKHGRGARARRDDRHRRRLGQCANLACDPQRGGAFHIAALPQRARPATPARWRHRQPTR